MVYCRLCEKLRGDTGQRRRSSGRAARSSSLSLFLTLAYPLRFSLLLPAPSNGPTSCAALTLSSSRRCSSRFKTRSKSRRRGVSLWGFEGRVVSLSLDLLFPPPPPRRRPNSFHVSFPFAGSPLSFSITPPSLLLFPFPFFRSRGAVFSRVRTRTQISALAEPRIATRRGATSGFCFWIFVLCSADSFQVIRTTSFLSAERLTARPEEIWSVEDFRGRNYRIETANFTRLPAKRFPRTPRLVPVV